MEFEKIDAHVGHRIRVKRLLLGLSQSQLSEKLSLSFQQIQKYEKGTNRISAGKLFHIAEALGEPIDFFFRGLKENGSSHSADQPHKTETWFGDIEVNKEITEMVSAFSRVKDPQAKKQIKELLRVIAEPKGKSFTCR